MELLTQNSELKPLGVFNWTLPAFVVQLSNGKHFNVCPHAGACAQVCYARSGKYNFRPVKQAHTTKLEMVLYDLPLWKAKMLAELSKSKYRNKWIRIHDAGDFFSAEYLNAWIDIARQRPNTRFYCYTKEVALFREHVEFGIKVEVGGDDPEGLFGKWYKATDPATGHIAGAPHPEQARRMLIGDRLPENFLYIFSMGGKQDSMIDKDIDRHAEIFHTFRKLWDAGYDDQEEDDTQCVTNENIKVGVIENNIPAFKRKLAGRTFGEIQAEQDAKRTARRERLEDLVENEETAESNLQFHTPNTD